VPPAAPPPVPLVLEPADPVDPLPPAPFPPVPAPVPPVEPLPAALAPPAPTVAPLAPAPPAVPTVLELAVPEVPVGELPLVDALELPARVPRSPSGSEEHPAPLSEATAPTATVAKKVKRRPNMVLRVPMSFPPFSIGESSFPWQSPAVRTDGKEGGP